MGALQGAWGGKGRERAGELIKARFVDVMRGQPPSCWLSMTQRFGRESAPAHYPKRAPAHMLLPGGNG